MVFIAIDIFKNVNEIIGQKVASQLGHDGEGVLFGPSNDLRNFINCGREKVSKWGVFVKI